VKKERDAGLEERKKYVADNQDAMDQIIPRLQKDPDYKFTGKLAPFQAEWMRLADERKAKEAAFQDLRAEVDRETSIASKSVVRQAELAKMKGNIEVTEMLLNLTLADHGELPYKVKLRKYAVSEGGSERVENARWVIAEIEGATEEAKAAAATPAKRIEPLPVSASSESSAAESSAPPPERPAAGSPAAAASSGEHEREEANYKPRELRGIAKIQTLAPESKIVGDEVISTVRVRNASKDWITGFMVTEHWYDKSGNAVGSNSQTHRSRFMPGEVLVLELKTRKGADFYQNQYKFSHANGEVQAQSVQSFPKS
jgi:hypothetical protein